MASENTRNCFSKLTQSLFQFLSSWIWSGSCLKPLGEANPKWETVKMWYLRCMMCWIYNNCFYMWVSRYKLRIEEHLLLHGESVYVCDFWFSVTCGIRIAYICFHIQTVARQSSYSWESETHTWLHRATWIGHGALSAATWTQIQCSLLHPLLPLQLIRIRGIYIYGCYLKLALIHTHPLKRETTPKEDI